MPEQKKPKTAQTIAEFCAEFSISRQHFYALRKRGEGPRLFTLGSRIFISQESKLAWVREREAATQQLEVAA